MYAKYCKLRDAKGMTDNAVAVAIGVTQSTIYDWKQRSVENPDAAISFELLQKLADYFGVPLDYFRREKED